MWESLENYLYNYENKTLCIIKIKKFIKFIKIMLSDF